MMKLMYRASRLFLIHVLIVMNAVQSDCSIERLAKSVALQR